ncbi:MAG TPA: phosphatidate cytidylyltransferase [Flavisolibacter sp.]|nr:phosphatidate cytidylyltransferase [Flavisolibacter sp.]
MALNLQIFKTRALTAVVFVVVMMGGLLWNKWSFFLLFSIVHFGCWIEYQKLLVKINPDYSKIIPAHRYGIMIAGWCILLYFSNDELWLFGINLREVGLWTGILSMIILPLIIFIESRAIFIKNMAQSVFGLLYISVPIGVLVDIRMTTSDLFFWGMDQYLFYVFFIILTLWINDTMAYVVGSFIGKRPLSSISPKKTWEGTIGGILLAVGVMTLIGNSAGIEMIDAIVISAIASISGTYGDLFESRLKRMAGVKDSGQIMPGHGGFLDRFDSLLFAAVFTWFYISLFVMLI